MIAKVIDTETFVAASQLVHGEKYDYSQAVFISSRDKLTIKCPTHGEFQQLPDSHYRKGCGCRQCGMEKRFTEGKFNRKECDYCGEWLRKNKNPKCQKPECVYDRKREKWLKKCKPCRTCNKLFVGKDRVFCSAQCNPSSPMVVIEKCCCVCGFEYKKKVSQRHVVNSKTCSLECQRQWALVKNQHTPSIDWLKRSKKAKVKWKRMRSRERKRKWVVRRELTRVREKRRAYEQRQTMEGQWRYRIRSRRVIARGRDAIRKSIGLKKTTIRMEIYRLREKRKWFEKCLWRKKVCNKLSSLTKRRRRKRNVKAGRIKRRSYLSENRRAAVQMCFEWD